MSGDNSKRIQNTLNELEDRLAELEDLKEYHESKLEGARKAKDKWEIDLHTKSIKNYAARIVKIEEDIKKGRRYLESPSVAAVGGKRRTNRRRKQNKRTRKAKKRN
jgi:DNA repair ATPase RecN